jgi:hypothetical protein
MTLDEQKIALMSDLVTIGYYLIGFAVALLCLISILLFFISMNAGKK